MSGARSVNCSRFDTSFPDNTGLGCPPWYVNDPFRSLPPTRPVKFSYLKTFPASRNWPTSRPSVAYGDVSGNVVPVTSYRCAMLTPASHRRKSSAARC
jgi:hypothetical protein